MFMVKYYKVLFAEMYVFVKLFVQHRANSD